MHAQSNVIGYPQLTPEGTLTFRARHVYENSQLLIDGEPVDAELECVEGALPTASTSAFKQPFPRYLSKGLLPVTAAEFAWKIQQRSVFLFRCHGARSPIGRSLKADRRFDQCESRDASWEFVELNGSVSCDGGQLRHRLTRRRSPNPGESKSFTGFPCWPTGSTRCASMPARTNPINLDLSR